MIRKIEGGVSVLLSEDGSCMEMFCTGHSKLKGKAFGETPARISRVSLTILDGKIFVRETLVDEKERA